MKRLRISTSGFGLLAVAAVCLALGGWGAYSTHRFIARAEKAAGVVFYSPGDESNTLLVRMDDASVSGRIIPVRAAWWPLPWDYLEGDVVSILCDPTGDYDALLFPDRATIDTWPQLYLTSTLWIAAGLILAAVALFSGVKGGQARMGFVVKLE